MIIQNYTAGFLGKTQTINTVSSVKASFKSEIKESGDSFESKAISEPEKKMIYNISSMIKEINDKEEKFKAFNAAINILKEQGKDNFILGLCGLAECISDLAPGHQGTAIYTIYNNVDWEHPFANYVCGYLSKSVNCLNDFSAANLIYDLAKKIDTKYPAGAEFAREELIRGLLFSDMNESKKFNICLNLINDMDPKKSGNTPFNRMKYSVAGAEVNGRIDREKSNMLVELIEQKERERKSYIAPPQKPKKKLFRRLFG